MYSRIFVGLTLGVLATAVSFCNVASAQHNDKSTEPEPIKIVRDGGPPKIPDVDRDKVICFALYTVQDRILKLSAQLYPLQVDEAKEISLQINDGDQWKTVATEPIDLKGWMATFRIEDWDHSKDHQYRVTHPGGAEYGGTIRRDPTDKAEIVVAAFTGNSNTDRSMREDIVRNVKAFDPDLLFFSGDQSYDHQAHTAAWLLFGRQFGDIIRDRPTITIPDDHDVGQPNLWGAGGKVSTLPGASDGGFAMPAEYVNMVQKAQCSHLPDPFDATPVLQNISVYYTSLNVGGIDFAIVEDRKWKSGPAGLIPQQGPRPDHINDPAYDRASVDVPEARLLGERQLKFLDQWGKNWDGAVMKSILSQTIFAGGAHIHGKSNERLLADLDSNGWPQSGRARALIAMRKCFGFHIAGDQHLATVIHHGINSWEDCGYSFCVPSIVNYYARWWWPLEEPQEHDVASPLPFTGRSYDGFGNKLTMHAYGNPTKENHNAAGFGIVRFNKQDRSITMECWPRHIDVTAADARQFPGWPITINQFDNYGREPLAWLPTLKITGATDPVVIVTDEYLDEVVYSVRIKGAQWRPMVFREATYSVTVKANDKTQTIPHITSTARDVDEPVTLEF